jgi:hypothetical protein
MTLQISTLKGFGHLLFLFLAPAAFAAAPVITQQPVNQTIFLGDPTTFLVAASGSEPLEYQWFRNGVPLAAADECLLHLLCPAATTARFSVSVSNGEVLSLASWRP